MVGNLDEKVDERVIYEIMMQAGPLANVYIPRDKETGRHKGYGFAEFTTEKSAQYAVSLFSGLVSLHKKLLRFSISGQGKETVTQDKYGQAQEGKHSVNNVPLEPSSLSSLQSPSISYPSVRNGYFGTGQRLNFSPLAYAQNYNARLVSLGQMELRTSSQDYSYPHPLY